MTRSVFQRYARKETGDAIPSAQITVVTSGGGVADIYTSEIGGTPVSQPLLSDANGYFIFYVDAGVYDVTATDPVTFSAATFTREEIGSARTSLIDDDQSSPAYSLLNPPPASYLINDLSLAYVFPTLAAAVSSDVALPFGKEIMLQERVVGDGLHSNWVVVDSGAASLNIYDTIVSSGVPAQAFMLELKQGATLNPRLLGATDGIGADETESTAMRVANSALMNFALDKYKSRGISVDIIIRTHGSILVHSGQTVKGVNRESSGIIGYHPTEPAFIDDTFGTPSDTNNTSQMYFKNLGLESLVSDKVFHITPYKCVWENNSFRCPNGTAFKIHDGGYQVENVWRGNNFNACETGIEAFGGAYNPTDNFYIDNYFFSEDISIYHLRLSNASGSVFRGNHYYGGNLKEYVRLSFSQTVRFIGEYFEYNEPLNLPGVTNPHIIIVGGNPTTVTFSGCDFWRGFGNEVDYEGEGSCSIKVTFSEFNPMCISLSACTFLGGSAGLPVFGFTNGGTANSSPYKISFDKSNIVQGTYTLLKKLGTSSVAGNVVQTDHPYFTHEVSTQNGDYINNTGGEIYSTYSGSTTSFPALPSNIDWLVNKPVVVNNVSTVTELQFSGGGAITIGGLNPVPPSTRVKIMQDPTGANDILIRKD